MFEVCFVIIKMLNKIKIQMIFVSKDNIIADIGKKHNDKTDARDEYFLINATNIQINIKIIVNLQSIANIRPINDATPLPPLNFNQIGKI